MNKYKKAVRSLIDDILIRHEDELMQNKEEFINFAAHHYQLLYGLSSTDLNGGEYDFFEEHMFPILYRVYRNLLKMGRFKIKIVETPFFVYHGTHIVYGHKMFTSSKYKYLKSDLIAFNGLDVDVEIITELSNKISDEIARCVHPDKKGTLCLYEIYPTDFWGKEWLWWSRLKFIEDGK